MAVTAVPAPPQQSAGMGQIVFVTAGQIARAVLGSCVGVAIYDPVAQIGALAHVVLPAATGRPGPPGKFADTAIPWMIESLEQRGAIRRRLVAKLGGGSKMFASQGPFLIGEENTVAARRHLSQFKIPLLGEHVGGSNGRRVTLGPDRWQLEVEIVGQSVVCL